MKCGSPDNPEEVGYGLAMRVSSSLPAHAEICLLETLETPKNDKEDHKKNQEVYQGLAGTSYGLDSWFWHGGWQAAKAPDTETPAELGIAQQCRKTSNTPPHTPL
ncbi:UNVERIFIED_CONTAM: hypothetical protein K2H54_015396 [Gekko kuhli]